MITPPLGIDLGTTRTSVAFTQPVDPRRGWDGRLQVLDLDNGTMTPSAVLFESAGHVVGAAAKNMGHRVKDCAKVFKREMPNGDWRFTPEVSPQHHVSAEELSSLLLSEIVAQARTRTGLNHQEVVITVPAYFGEPERRRTRGAAEQAGLDVLDIINEPVAALIAYLFQEGVAPLHESVLVFDLGGGTFDTVVVDVDGNSVRVTAIDGDLLLGGRDFDATIATALSDRFHDAYPEDVRPTADPAARERLMLQIELAREQLSSVVAFDVPVWGGERSGGVSLNASLTRDEVDGLVSSLVDRCLMIARRAIERGAGRGARPTRVLFVGGMTRTPTIRNRVMAELGLQELPIHADPDLLVARGAALWARRLAFENEIGEILEREIVDGDESWVQNHQLDLEDERVKKVVRRVAKDARASVGGTRRLLALDVQSISSRGYALRVARDMDHLDDQFLDYLLAAGTPLPFEHEPKEYLWSTEKREWTLGVYEDLPDHPGTPDVEAARLVEQIVAPMSKTWPKGSPIRVQFSMGVDQILCVRGWQVDGDDLVDEMEVRLDPGFTG